MPSRIKTGFALGEPMPANLPADYDWLRENRIALFEKYGKCIIVIFEKQVLGTGATYPEAIANAEANLVDDIVVVTPIVTGIGSPHKRFSGFFRQVRKK